MTNIHFIIEIKQEYTTQLINTITPLIYEGLLSIYCTAQDASTTENVLSNFQILLQDTPKWNNTKIHDETERIKNNTKSYAWLENLIKSTLKSNIILLTYNPCVSKQEKIDPSTYQNIKIDDFIHRIYIECAREFWNNPYLFYHNYPPIELKRNQRDSILLIKECIKEAIRKLLPLERMLKIYLKEEITDQSITNESEIVQKLMNKQQQEEDDENNQTNQTDQTDHTDYNTKNITDNKSDNTDNKTDNTYNKTDNSDQKGGSVANTDTVGSQILNIINKNIKNKNIKLTETSAFSLNKKEKYDIDSVAVDIKNYNHPEIYSNADAIKKIYSNENVANETKNVANETKNVANETKTVIIKNKDRFLSKYLQI